MPIKQHSPPSGVDGAGGVSERAGAKAGGIIPSAIAKSSPSRVVMVEGILVVWKATLFAGRRRNGGLDRSESFAAVPPQ